jgi:hypothetical protein
MTYTLQARLELEPTQVEPLTWEVLGYMAQDSKSRPQKKIMKSCQKEKVRQVDFSIEKGKNSRHYIWSTCH